MKNYPYIILSALLLVLTSQRLHAVNIVNWQGDYVSSSQGSSAGLNDISGSPSGSDSIRERGEFGVQANPASNYSGTSANFFAGAQITKLGVNSANGLANIDVIDSGANDYIQLYAQSPSGTTGSQATYFTSWTTNVRYGDINDITTSSAGGMSGSVTSRIFIKDNSGNYYVSQNNITGGFGGADWGLNSTDLATNSWALYAASGDNWFGNLGSLTFDQSVASSTTITEIGWLAYANNAGGSWNSSVTINKFIVDGTPIPEASTYAMLAGSAVLLFACIRKRKRS